MAPSQLQVNTFIEYNDKNLSIMSNIIFYWWKNWCHQHEVSNLGNTELYSQYRNYMKIRVNVRKYQTYTSDQSTELAIETSSVQKHTRNFGNTYADIRKWSLKIKKSRWKETGIENENYEKNYRWNTVRSQKKQWHFKRITNQLLDHQMYTKFLN
jgi:hypothetical protein